jgi:predicted DNA-binding transcriptional regulator YafY
LDAGRCLQKTAVLAEFGISPATLMRDLAHLRDRMNAPVVFDRERKGWRLERAAQLAGTQYELPGLWPSADEIDALPTMQQLLANLDAGGLLGPHFEAVGTALLRRRRQHIDNHGRGRGAAQERQRLPHARGDEPNGSTASA